MNALKEFLYFTKSKLITYILLSAVLIYYMIQQDKTLGNFTWFSLIIILIVEYILLNILWFSSKGRSHFLIALVILIILIGSAWFFSNRSSLKRANAYEDCLKDPSVVGPNVQIKECMEAKGFEFEYVR